MSDNNTISKTGRITSFHKLYENDRIKIVIPKIQRDFAYGRPSNSVNRARLLDSICDAINLDPKKVRPLRFDFVYGRLDENKVPHEFEPIDGQQRLTILFLLYLYIAKRSRQNDVSMAFLNHFTYKTRQSSEDFCERLLVIPAIFFDRCKRECRYINNCTSYKNIVEYIKDQWWFNSSWALDPTIASMLGMLDAIDERLGGYSLEEMQKIWILLKTNIDFWLLSLEDLKATDDLYIKMNSRGKKLTDFEHFKAELERYSKSAKQLSLKIDTTWTDKLWQYRTTKDSPEEELDIKKDTYANNGLSEKFLNLFYRMIIMESVKKGYIENYPGDKAYDVRNILNLAIQVLPGHPDILNRIEKVMDFFCGLKSIPDFFNELFSNVYPHSVEDIPLSYSDYKIYFSTDTVDFLQFACNDNSTAFKKTLILEALFEYAYLKKIGEEISDDDLKDRLRILRNLQNNLQVHNDEMRGLLNATADFIRTGNLTPISQNNAYTQPQRDQEAFKRDTWKVLHTNREWLTLITLENTYFLYGNLAPIMHSESSLETKHMTNFLTLVCDTPWLNGFRRALLTYGDYATVFKGVRKYAADSWARWYSEIFIFANKSFAPAFIRMSNHFPKSHNIESRNNTFNRIKSNFCNECVAKSRYPWIFYMVAYDNIFSNPRAIAGLYRAGHGLYDHKMVTGTKGKSWNPYLLALASSLPGATLGDWYDKLYFEGKQIWVSERELNIEYSDGPIVRRKIPCSLSGIDTVNRVEFARRLLLGLSLNDSKSQSVRKRFLPKKRIKAKGYKGRRKNKRYLQS